MLIFRPLPVKASAAKVTFHYRQELRERTYRHAVEPERFARIGAAGAMAW
jgi:hypothetical protein